MHLSKLHLSKMHALAGSIGKSVRLMRLTLASVFLSCFLLALAPNAATAQVRIIRDAEVESMIRDFATPFLKAAGMRSIPRVYIVADRRFNAFVIEDGSMFINYGTIIDSRTANMLKGVIAHELGHLAGGHLARIRERAETQQRMQAVAMLLGVGAAAAASGSSAGGEITQVATAFILAANTAGVNSLAAYRRSEESAADAAAIKLLTRTGQSAAGMVEVLEELKAREGIGASPYLRTHPAAEDRLASVRKTAQASPHWGKKDSASDRKRFELARAKLVGFLETRQTVLNYFPNSDKSQAALYARIITAYKSGAAQSALQLMPSLVAKNPSNPYFQELLGQMYYETGNAAKGTAPLKKAVKLAPKETQIRIIYGQTLLDTGKKADLDEAILQLTRSTREEPDSGRAFSLLSRAYGKSGKPGEASLAAAETALISGNPPTALGLARKAQEKLEKGSPAWLRADDILKLN